MYKTIMVPVDLEHVAQLEKALATAADLARHYKAEIIAVGVTDVTPGSVAHNPSEFDEKLAGFAAEQTEKRGVSFKSKAAISHDPAVEIEEALQASAHEIGADLIVMASHIPGVLEYLIASRAGYLASHSDLSVFVVR